jgi:CheY-like chemotaxis protein
MNVTALGNFIKDCDPLFQFFSALIWPAVALAIILIFKSKIDSLLDSARWRKLTFKAADFEITMEDAIKQQDKIIADLQDKILQGKSKPKNLHSLLWVDDNPGNNAMLIQNFQGKGISITTAYSTAEAVTRLKTGKFDAIISDMGRTEFGARNDVAGVDLAKEIRSLDKEIPIFIYSKSEIAKRMKKQIKDIGIDYLQITTSKSDLLEALWNL